MSDKPGTKFRLLQQWEGVVQEVLPGEFAATLRDLTAQENAEEQVLLGLDEVSTDDLPLVEPGAVFYWSIGYETTVQGQRKRVSLIRFRRLPVWSARDLSNAKERAEALMRAIGIDADNDVFGTARLRRA